jgi:hypothetical protein
VIIEQKHVKQVVKRQKIDVVVLKIGLKLLLRL